MCEEPADRYHATAKCSMCVASRPLLWKCKCSLTDDVKRPTTVPNNMVLNVCSRGPMLLLAYSYIKVRLCRFCETNGISKGFFY